VGRENNTSYYSTHTKLKQNSRIRERQYNKGDSNMNYTDHSKNKKLQDYMSSYNREVTMSQYVTIPKTRLRRLIITEVIAWGVAGLALIASIFH
jgi:sortase (surface protein transpeptidase)